MKIFVYNATFFYRHTSTDGKEVRTSPQTMLVGAADEREAAKLLPQVEGEELQVAYVLRAKGIGAVTIA